MKLLLSFIIAFALVNCQSKASNSNNPSRLVLEETEQAHLTYIPHNLHSINDSLFGIVTNQSLIIYDIRDGRLVNYLLARNLDEDMHLTIFIKDNYPDKIWADAEKLPEVLRNRTPSLMNFFVDNELLHVVFSVPVIEVLDYQGQRVTWGSSFTFILETNLELEIDRVKISHISQDPIQNGYSWVDPARCFFVIDSDYYFGINHQPIPVDGDVPFLASFKNNNGNFTFQSFADSFNYPTNKVANGRLNSRLFTPIKFKSLEGIRYVSNSQEIFRLEDGHMVFTKDQNISIKDFYFLDNQLFIVGHSIVDRKHSHHLFKYRLDNNISKSWKLDLPEDYSSAFFFKDNYLYFMEKDSLHYYINKTQLP